jgi:hypothetical protein
VNLERREVVKMAKQFEDETDIEWYARKLGSVHCYTKLTPGQLRRKLSALERDYRAIQNHLKSDPDSIFGNEISDLIAPHYEAIMKECRKRSLRKAA